ncbi:MAG: response regulator transcription factor [Clostridia bacterium]|nr:response regulator transcription factor [Clostridia bacterium]
MINIGICDDDTSSINYTKKLIESGLISIEFDAEISIATSNQQAIYSRIEKREIDILFLDINFNNGKNGIEFANELRKVNKKFKLVFVTSHFEYAMLAFSCKTFDYILKPIDIDKITYVLERLKDDLMAARTRFIKVNKDYTIRTEDIYYIEHNKSKTAIYTKDSVYETTNSLNTILDSLPDYFIRNHRSFIINQNEVAKIDKDDRLIYFNNGLNCPIGNLLHLI